MTLRVTSVDNRGDDTVPFGWVYFSDDTRAGFGNTRDGFGTFGVFPGTWGPVTPKHFMLADHALTEMLPHVVRA